MSEEKSKSRNASPVMNGFLFQINVAIFLFIRYIKEIARMRVEGKKEDIEATLENNNRYMVQVKAQMDPKKKGNVMPRFLKALDGLVESDSRKVERLIYATNFLDPLNSKDQEFMDNNGVTFKKYNELSDSSKQVIDNKLDKILKDKGKSIDKKKIWLLRIPFAGEDEKEKHKFIYEEIKLFLKGINEDFNYVDFVDNWESIFWNNGASRSTANVTKDDLKTYLIFISIQGVSPQIDYRALGVNENYYDEACDKYDKFIEEMGGDYEMICKVNSLYENYSNSNKFSSKEDFIIKNGESLMGYIFATNIEDDSQDEYSHTINRITAQLIAAAILQKKWIINKINRKVDAHEY